MAALSENVLPSPYIIVGNISDDEYEVVFTLAFTRNVPKADLDRVRLRYIPDYVWDLVVRRDYWEKAHRTYRDQVTLDKWRTHEELLKEEVDKHKRILRNIDIVRRTCGPTDDENHFSRSLDPARVRGLVDYLKANQGDCEIFHRISGHFRGKDREMDNILYLIYAIWSLYGEFRIRPSRPSRGAEVQTWIENLF